MTKFTLLSLTLMTFFSFNAFAHVEPGVWAGKTADGSWCAMVAARTYFDPEMAHPLNERVELSVQSDQFVVHHPTIVDTARSIAHFNHNAFVGMLATKNGAKALSVKMAHEENFEGPTSFVLIDHNWRTDARTKVECLNLQHQK